MDSVDGDVIRSERASEWRTAGAERGRGASAWIIPPASDREPNLRRQLHSAARAWLQRAGEPLHAGLVLPLEDQERPGGRWMTAPQ
jgi:hypothetical protein